MATTADLKSTTTRTKQKRRFSNNVPPGLHYLPPLDPKSEEFAELFRSFLSSKDERDHILALSEEDAKLFIEIIDRAFRAARLETELRQIALIVLRKLCGRTGYIPESYLLFNTELDLAGMPHACGGSADVRVGVFKGENVAVKSLRLSELDSEIKIRKRFCKEVATWKNLSHPNILTLIGIPDTLEDGRFSMVSKWMVNGNILEYVRSNVGNHLKLLADAAEGLEYLHNANIVHGGLKGADILITNTNPITACLADFGCTKILPDPGLGSSRYTFGLSEPITSKEADVFAMAAMIYAVLTGILPFGKMPRSAVVITALKGGMPLKPANALELGLSDGVWKLLEDCWKTDHALRPPIKDVSARVKVAASVCGTLSSVGGVTQAYGGLELDSAKFDQFFAEMASFDDEDFGTFRIHDLIRPERRDGNPGDRDVLSYNEETSHIVSPTVEADGNKRSQTGPTEPFASQGLGLEELIKFFQGIDDSNVPSQGADYIISLFKDRTGFKQLVNLERDQAQRCADVLDASLDKELLCGQSRTQCLKYLRRICGVFGILPSSFILQDTADEQGSVPFAKGGYSYVYRTTFQGRCVAVKTLTAAVGTGNLQKMHKLLAREVVGWKWLQHENILPFVGVTPGLAIISDLMENGNIMEFIANNPRHNRLHLLAGVAAGLEYLHSHNTVHGDLKGANVLVDSRCSARLADFGLATIIDESTVGSTTGGHELRGTTRWMAPEMLLPEEYGFSNDSQRQLPSMATDVYALGMTVLEVLTGERPFNDIKKEATVILWVMRGKKPCRPCSGFSDALWNLLLAAWDVEHGSEPSKRPSVQKILDQLGEDTNKWDQFVILPTSEQGDESLLLGNYEWGGSNEALIGTVATPEVVPSAGPAPCPPSTTRVPDVPATMDEDTQKPTRILDKPRWSYGPTRKIQEAVKSFRTRSPK